MKLQMVTKREEFGDCRVLLTRDKDLFIYSNYVKVINTKGVVFSRQIDDESQANELFSIVCEIMSLK